jgi:fatty acid desaturase
MTASLDKRELKHLSVRSDGRGLLQLAGHLGVLGATGAAVWFMRGSPWAVPALVAYAVVLTFLFAPLHETIHRTAFRRRWLNVAVAWLAAVPLLLPPAYFRAFHLAHHRHTQDPARDPELAHGKPETTAQYLWTVTGIPYWRERIATTVAQALGRVDAPFVTARERPRVVREARALLAVALGLIGASALAGSWAVVWLWLAPALVGQPFLRAYLLAEHTGCPFVPEMWRNTRTTPSLKPVRWLAWNMPYHAEHHAYPAVPFHRLPAAHARLRARLAHVTPGYLAAQREILDGLPHTVPGDGTPAPDGGGDGR